jgi:hypothetical protein
MTEPAAAVDETAASKPATLFEAVREEIMPKYENAREHLSLCPNGTQFMEDGAGMSPRGICSKTRFRNGGLLYCFYVFCNIYFKTWFQNQWQCSFVACILKPGVRMYLIYSFLLQRIFFMMKGLTSIAMEN